MSRSRPVSYQRLHELLSLHQRYLTDGVRNRAFRRALERYVTPRSRVLDIGCGTGIWAILAAKMGARSVLAVEKERLLVPIVRQLVRDNGVEDRVRVVLGDSRRLALGRRFDLVVSETLGNAAYEEQIVPIMADARRRFLKPGGATIPSAVALVAAPARAELPRLSVPLQWHLVDTLWACFTRVDERARVKSLARPQALVHTPLVESARTPSRRRLRADWSIEDARAMNAVALWVEAELAPGLILRTLSGTHWSPILLPIAPFPFRRAHLRLRLVLAGLKSHWEVTATTPTGRTETRSGSPLFAYGWVKSRLEPGEGG